MVTVVEDDLLAKVAVTAFGLVDELFAGMEIVLGVAFVTPRTKAFVPL
jgi:hypothetical protein